MTGPRFLPKSRVLGLIVILICATTLIVLLGVGIDFTKSSESDIKPIFSTSNGIYGVLWLNPNTLVLERTPNSTTLAEPTSLWTMATNGENLKLIDLPTPRNCTTPSFSVASRLPNGRLGYVALCNNAEFKMYWLAYDIDTGKSKSQINFDMPGLAFGSLIQAWDPQMAEGVAAYGGGLADHLFKFTKDGWQLLDVGFPQAYGAAWSPDGKHIAFLASKSASTPGGSIPPGDIYLMNPNGTNIRKLSQTPICDTAGPEWSPDSHWLIFAGPIGCGLFNTSDGIWALEASTGRLISIIHGRYSSPTWSPDGTKIAAIRLTGTNIESKGDVVIIDISGALKQ